MGPAIPAAMGVESGVGTAEFICPVGNVCNVYATATFGAIFECDRLKKQKELRKKRASSAETLR